ncbi:MAG: hypothetical protein ACXADY_08325 [Candidatus Hodarchaeales archaeon]|jgi:hypothetical protein
MALNIMELLSQTLVPWNFAILILGGFLAASWLFVRLAGVSSDDKSNIVDKLSLLGFPVGIISLIAIGAGLYLWSVQPGLFEDSNSFGYSTFDLVTIACLGILGLVLILRPIKDFRFGAFISLAIGLLGAGLFVFLGTESVQLIAVVFLILFVGIYLSIKIVEDLYILIAEVLSSPLISVIVGILCLLQGILQILGLSIGGIITLLLGG